VSVPPVIVTWPATPEDVAALLRARTQDNTDVEVGSWTTDTRPTLEEVERLLAMAQSLVLGETGPLTDDTLPCPSAEDVKVQAATCVALLAAMLVELSYFPEQVQSTRSAYEQYRDLFWGPDMKSGLIAALREAVAECQGGGVEPGGGGEDATVPPASWAFPKDEGGLVGWQTRW